MMAATTLTPPLPRSRARPLPSAALDQALASLPTLLVLDEAAAALRLHPNTVKRWLRAGRLRGVKLPSGDWRIDRDAVLELLGRAPAVTTALSMDTVHVSQGHAVVTAVTDVGHSDDTAVTRRGHDEDTAPGVHDAREAAG